jgi:uncharacterized protein with FMN-binding domain
MKKHFISALILSVAMSILSFLSGFDQDDKDFLSLASRITGYEEHVLEKGDTWRLAQYRNSDGEINYFAQSFDFAKIMGYSGYTNIAMVFDSGGKVVKVEILSSEDTRSYIRRLNRTGFLDQYSGYNGTQKLNLVTGATLSSKALNETVQQVSAQIRETLDSFLPEEK